MTPPTMEDYGYYAWGEPMNPLPIGELIYFQARPHRSTPSSPGTIHTFPEPGALYQQRMYNGRELRLLGRRLA